MESDNPEIKKNSAKEEVFSKGKSALPIMLISLCLTLMALSMLLWLPSAISYKNVSSLSELNENKVRYYTESQHIYLVYKSGEEQDTIRSVVDYAYSLKKANLQEEASLMAEFLATSKEENLTNNGIAEPLIRKISRSKSFRTKIEDIDTQSANGQQVDGHSRGTFSEKEKATIQPDEKPKFPQGLRGLELYLVRNKRTPFHARSQKVTGSVDLRFLLSVDGSISDIRILKGLGYGCDEEALRLIKNMPNWEPALTADQAVPFYQNLSIKF